MKKQNFLIIFLVLGFLAWQFYISRFDYGHVSPLDKPAPHFQAESVVDGALLDSTHLFGKKVVLVNFWATWCDTCRWEIPALNTLHDRLAESDFMIVSFVEDETADLPELQTIFANFNQKMPVKFPVYRDVDQEIAILYGTSKIPESYLIDLNGQVVSYHNGAITPSDVDDIVAKVQNLLKAKSQVPQQ